MKLYFLLIFWLLLAANFVANAQQASVSGSVADTVNFKPMAYSSIAIIRKSDSLLVSHQWANESATFKVDKLAAGNYILRITRPTFADYEEEISLTENEQKALGTIALYSKANLLRDVIIKEKRNAITIKGDTIEYLVDSFLVNKNSNVEDLLKKLPGIQVDKNGKITAQGQEVKKVLVDGEEFFGNDPTVATRNLKAENVEAVQVFDKKSNEAAFTGIEDGENNKTINLKLKDEAKKGYFGKASAGLGSQDRHEHDAMFNKFKDKQKISVYAAGSNTNKTGLSWEDEQKYGSNSNMITDAESGAVYSYFDQGVESFDGVGIPSTIYAGAVYTDKFKTDTHNINMNMKYQELSVSGFNDNYTKYILPDTLYFNNQRNIFSNAKQLIEGAGKYEWKIDSLTTLKINILAKEFKTQNNSQYLTENLNINNEKVNDNNRTQTSNRITNTVEVGLGFGRKFKTKGRSLSIDLSQNNTRGESDGFLLSSANFYEGGALKQQNLIDQKKLTTSNVNSFGGNIVYTEPLSTKYFLVTDFNSKVNTNESNRVSLDKDALGNYTTQVDSLSNSLRYDIFVNRGGLALKYNTKKIVYSIGGKVSYTDLQQRLLDSNITTNQYFLNIFPSANFQYKIRNSSTLKIGYTGRTNQPSLQQIQPIIDNANPLDIFVGNPQLEQSFTNAFSFSYNSYKPVTGSGVYTYGGMSFIKSDFTRFDQIDQFGRRIHQTVNVNGNKSGYFGGYYWRSIKSIETQLSCGIKGNYSENNNFINGLANTNYNTSFSPNANLYYDLEEKLEVSLGGDWSYNRTTSTLRQDIVTQFWISTYEVQGTYKITKKYSIESNCAFNYRQQTVDFAQNFNTIIWNAAVSRMFLKESNLVLKAGCNDILNQNIGFRRDASSNYVNENTYTVLKRYFMFSLTWNFSNGGIAGGDNE